MDSWKREGIGLKKTFSPISNMHCNRRYCGLESLLRKNEVRYNIHAHCVIVLVFLSEIDNK